MKRYIFLLALPYVVALSSYSCETNYLLVPDLNCGKDLYRIEFKGKLWTACDPKEACEDLAAALNEAHEQRTHPKNEITGETDDEGKLLYWKTANPEKQIRRPEPFDYDGACRGSCSEDK